MTASSGQQQRSCNATFAITAVYPIRALIVIFSYKKKSRGNFSLSFVQFGYLIQQQAHGELHDFLRFTGDCRGTERSAERNWKMTHVNLLFPAPKRWFTARRATAVAKVAFRAEIIFLPRCKTTPNAKNVPRLTSSCIRCRWLVRLTLDGSALIQP